MPNSTKVITGKVRLSYVHVFEPYSATYDQDPKYSVTLLIPKSDKDTIAKLRAAQQTALEQGKAKFGGKVPTGWKDTIHDGDEEADLEKNPEYAGHLYMSVSSKTQPHVVDAAVNPILDSTEIYSGCYARVSLNAFAYSTSGNKGVSFGLGNIQKMADGTTLGGRMRAEEEFSALDDDLL